MSTTHPTPGTDTERLTAAERATPAETAWSLWRPVLVNGAAPVLLGLLFGWHYGFGSGWLLTATRIVGWVFAALWFWWFWWSVGTFNKYGITLNPNWRKRPFLPWKARTSPEAPWVLITTGPYRWSQAPMFFGVYCGLLAAGFLLTYWAFAWAVVFITGMTLYILLKERPDLAIRHPEVKPWQAETPSLVPYTIVTIGFLAAVFWLFAPRDRKS